VSGVLAGCTTGLAYPLPALTDIANVH